MPRPLTREQLLQRIAELEADLEHYRTELKTMEAAEKWFSRIIQGLPIATFVIDRDHRVVTANKAHEKLTGIPNEAILGTDSQWQAFYDRKRPVMADLIVDQATEADISAYYYGKYRKSKTVEGAYEAEDFFPALGERGKWIYFTAAPIRSADGTVTGALETLQDITAQKDAVRKLIESERRLQTLLDFVPYPIVVFTRKGRVHYLNPAFTQIFGWTFQELFGKAIPYDPPERSGETAGAIQRVMAERTPKRYETRRTTKDGRTLDVVIRMAAYSDARGKAIGLLMILRDVTREKREARNAETIHRVSLALPAYPELGELLDFISGEVRQLMDTEGAIVTLLDEEREEIRILGASYDDPSIEKRVKESRFAMDGLVAGKVIQTGQPIIVEDALESVDNYRERDRKLGYTTRNLILVPLHSGDRTIGVLGAINKKEGAFEQRDIDMLSTIGSTVALSIENARYSDELKRAYQEVRSLNRAKDKVIHHLSHELKTPIAVLSGSLSILARKMAPLDDAGWQTTVERARRNLDRLVEIQDEVNDIVQGGRPAYHDILSRMMIQCADELETLLAEEMGESGIMDRIRQRMAEVTRSMDLPAEAILLSDYVRKRLDALDGRLSGRSVAVVRQLEPVPAIHIPEPVLGKIVDGCIRNAVENTPDGGRIEVSVRRQGKGAAMVVRDFGVGIPAEDRKRIFEGFFPTVDTMDYATRKPYEFNAGGKGADLLRMKIFSQRYGFRIDMASSRCRFVTEDQSFCPGSIPACPHCASEDDCRREGGTTFTFYFPPGDESIPDKPLE